MYSAFFDNGNILYKFSTFIRTAQRERCFYASMQCTPNFFNLKRESQKKFMKSPPTQRERSEPWTIYLPTRPTAQLTASVTSKGLGGHRGRPHEACFDFRGYMASFNLLALKLRPWIGDMTRDRQIWICCMKHCNFMLCKSNSICHDSHLEVEFKRCRKSRRRKWQEENCGDDLFFPRLEKYLCKFQLNIWFSSYSTFVQ